MPLELVELETTNIESLSDRLIDMVRTNCCDSKPNKAMCTAEGRREQAKKEMGDFWAQHESFCVFSTCPCWLGDGQCARELLEGKLRK